MRLIASRTARLSSGISVICERCLHRSPLSCSVAAPWRRAEANGLAAALDGVQIEESAIKQWHGLAWGAGAANPERAQRFEQADRVVVEAFADLHEARHLRSKFPAMSRGLARVRA